MDDANGGTQNRGECGSVMEENGKEVRNVANEERPLVVPSVHALDPNMSQQAIWE